MKEINLRFCKLNYLKKIILTAGYLKKYSYLCGNKLKLTAHFDTTFNSHLLSKMLSRKIAKLNMRLYFKGLGRY
jgi:hypothetical protein